MAVSLDYIHVQTGEWTVSALADSGSNVNAISHNLYELINNNFKTKLDQSSYLQIKVADD